MKIEFWIKSSRGTDETEVFTVAKGTPKEELRCRLERWCSQFGAWHVSGNCVSYGFRAPTKKNKP